jgi:hypothetical protein
MGLAKLIRSPPTAAEEHNYTQRPGDGKPKRIRLVRFMHCTRRLRDTPHRLGMGARPKGPRRLCGESQGFRRNPPGA